MGARQSMLRANVMINFTPLNCVAKKLLEKNQESELCSRIFRFAQVGYPLTSKTFKLNVYKYCDKNGNSHRFSKGSAGRH